MTTINTNLNGSEKQVAWAEDIRTSIVANLDAHVARMSHVYDGEKYAEFVAKFDETFFGGLRKVEDAKWYIDHRWFTKLTGNDIVKALYRELTA